MKNRVEDIQNAIERHGAGTARRTNGKISDVNIAREAGVSRATFYRYLKKHTALQNQLDAIQGNKPAPLTEPPQTIQEALEMAKKEIKELRIDIKNKNQEAETREKLFGNQLFLLKRESIAVTDQNRRLENINARLKLEVDALRSEVNKLKGERNREVWAENVTKMPRQS